LPAADRKRTSRVRVRYLPAAGAHRKRTHEPLLAVCVCGCARAPPRPVKAVIYYSYEFDRARASEA